MMRQDAGFNVHAIYVLKLREFRSEGVKGELQFFPKFQWEEIVTGYMGGYLRCYTGNGYLSEYPFGYLGKTPSLHRMKRWRVSYE